MNLNLSCEATPVFRSIPVQSEHTLAMGPQAASIDTTGRRNTMTSEDFNGVESAAFDLKVVYSQLSMHLGRTWRESLFRQLDVILDPESWESDDAIPDKNSWRTLLRLFIYHSFKHRPGLAFNGPHPIAIWQHGDQRVSLECRPDDVVFWVASRFVEDSLDVASGETKVTRLLDYLTPFNGDRWLTDGEV